ncbi:MAG: dihydroorotate dehydrogenase electron transfer subunit [Dictyoglomus sp.]|nr:dihydroorotate dehydrogenase electron transfer subunit [Dictyoglomus sp.]MCX7942328.1 dihydroorotate dehydrogenase electron transfer subunit [Dictyoglomaceae bacterium]MDW8188639.1 dihydroorotate dehydrogenase electron transfer subunit [Dictyoglomus sp.]
MMEDFEIIENERLDKDIFLLKLKNNGSFRALPGQFAMIKINDSYDPLLLRPFSFYNVSREEIEFLYQIKGKGTYILSRKIKGNKLKIIAPLGTSFPLPSENEKIAIVGGGMGIVPLSFLLNFISEKNIKIYSFIGFSTKISKKIWKEFERKSSYFIISTENGTLGEKGKILEFVKDLNKFDRIYSCGPISMLKELWKKVENKSKLYLSLEERMGCGIGICLGCVFYGKEKNLHICKDGPVVSGGEVNFE